MKTKRLLFIDRDGTIIEEPPVDFQVDSFSKLAFLPGVLKALKEISDKTDYELVMVTNQDGLGTSSFPEEDFWPVHNLMMSILKSEGIEFSEVFIDRSFPEEKLPSRKPGTAMLKQYFSRDYDLENSYVIGDRYTDVQLAKNLGAKAIFISENENDLLTRTLQSYNTLTSLDWNEIAKLLVLGSRTAKVLRETKETKISIELDLDKMSNPIISTGLKFFDHMLEQIAWHGNVKLNINVEGDLEVDEHHTIEDTALALGEAFNIAFGNKNGANRYGFLLPMDDCLAQMAIDFGGRPWLMWDVSFKREKIGDVPTEMFMHFFKSFSDNAKCNLNISAKGDNEHHKIEAIFKALGRSIRQAKTRNLETGIPSSKGVL